MQREGSRIEAGALVFHLLKEKFNFARLGITVSKKFGSAVRRNLLKRRVREAFRLRQFPPGLVIHVLPRGKELPSLAQIQKDFTLIC